MNIHRTTVPRDDVVAHHITTRAGERLCLMADRAGTCHLFAYGGADLDSPAWEIVLDPDEAAQLADLIGERGR